VLFVFAKQSKRIEGEYETELQRLLNNKAALLQKLNRLKGNQQLHEQSEESNVQN
jgi:hypothetical protein